MYGLLAGCQGALDRRERSTWRSYMCGLCESLSRAFGPAARLLATPDMALLALLTDAQSAVVAAPSPSRCLGRQPFYLRVANTTSRGSRFARCINIAAAVARIEDAVRDGDFRPRWLARLGATVLRPAASRAHAELEQLGFDPGILTRMQQESALVEGSSSDFHVLAAPVEEAYAAVFGHTAALAERGDNRSALGEMGRWFGRLAYVSDAALDYRRDAARRRYNVLSACFGASAKVRGTELAATASEQLRQGVARVHLTRHQDLIAQLLSSGLARKVSWACRGSGGARRSRVCEPKKPEGGARSREGPSSQPFWKGWGCSGGWGNDTDACDVATCLGWCCCGCC
jgi:hypothetical protein